LQIKKDIAAIRLLRPCIVISNTKKPARHTPGSVTYWQIMEAVFNRVNDAVKDGTTIKYLSSYSYVDRIFRSLEKQALYAENRRQVAMRKKRENEAHEFFNKPKEVPFYNWLER
jgi:hypothetical protein